MEYKDITILLVDSDEYHSSIFKNNLHRKGITSPVKSFTNSFLLERYLFDEKIDHASKHYLMLIDINLPGLDSQNFSKKIKEDYSHNNLTIFALSDMSNDQDIGDFYQNMLSKPLVQKIFEDKLEKLNILIQSCKISCTKKLVMLV